MGGSAQYEFYLDPESEESVFAVSKESKGKRADGLVEGFASTFDRPNSSVSWTAMDPSVFGQQLSEGEAREIHPRLFDRLGEAES